MKQVRIARKKDGQISSPYNWGEANDFNIKWLQDIVDEFNEEYKNFGFEFFLEYQDLTETKTSA